MSDLVIAALDTTPLMVDLERPITTAQGTIARAPLLLIDIRTREGVVGHSYLFCYTPRAVKPLAELVTSLGDILIGRSVDPLDRYADLEAAFRLIGRQGLVAMAIGGIDMALWDARAKAHGLGVARLLGAAPVALPCYDSLGVFVPDRDTALIEASLARGFQALKVKIGGGTLDAEVEALRALRAIIGPAHRLMVDYNQSLSVPEAIRRIRRFEDEGFALDWVEEPVAAEDFAGHAAVRAAVATPIQTGENWWLPDDAARALQAKVSDHAMLDLMKIGGVTGWMRAAGMALAASTPVSSHIFPEASAHVMAATPNRHLVEHLDLASVILADPLTIENGRITPKGPGLGLEWNNAAVARFRL